MACSAVCATPSTGSDVPARPLGAVARRGTGGLDRRGHRRRGAPRRRRSAGCGWGRAWRSPTGSVAPPSARCPPPASASSRSTVASVVDSPLPEPVVTVVQAIPKGNRGELAVEVLTEVGVARIVPWAAARSVAVWKGERAAEVRGALARDRARGGQAGAPPVVPGRRRPGSTADVVELIAGADLAVVLHEEATAPLVGAAPCLRRARSSSSSAPRAVSATTRSRRSRPPARTSYASATEVLRTSTAGVAAVAALLSRTPRWR